jgi:hypothetical protein
MTKHQRLGLRRARAAWEALPKERRNISEREYRHVKRANVIRYKAFCGYRQSLYIPLYGRVASRLRFRGGWQSFEGENGGRVGDFENSPEN